MSRVIIVPRWSGTPQSDWYPWITTQLASRGVEVTVVPLLPQPGAPVIEPCLEALGQAIAASPGPLADLVLVGHSVGCQVVVRHLAERSGQAEARVGAVLCVAGWWTVDAPWETIRPWIEHPFSVERSRGAAARWSVLLSDNDPFTADHSANSRLWVERTGAAVSVVPGARHFNLAEEPAVLEALGGLLPT